MDSTHPLLVFQDTDTPAQRSARASLADAVQRRERMQRLVDHASKLVDIYEDDPAGLIMRDAGGRADLVWPLELTAPVADPVCSFLLTRYGAPKGGAL